MQFIQAILNDKIVFKDRKKAEVSNQILEHTSALNNDVDRLLRINIMSLTNEMVKELSKEIAATETEFKFWSKETPQNQFKLDVEGV